MVNFEVAGNRLIRLVSLRIRNGERTERQLARLVGVSQPQLHNVLKGARPLKRELADALLAHFQISLRDLVEPDEGTGGITAFGIPRPAGDGLVRRQPGRASTTSAGPERQAV